MSIEKLKIIRERLAKLTAAESTEIDDHTPPKTEISQTKDKSTTQLNVESEIKTIIKLLDELISNYKDERLWRVETTMEKELLRTTSQLLKPPATPGPHEINW